MKDFIGGIEPQAKVRVLDKKTKREKQKKLGDLKAGEWLGQADSYYYFSVNEVRVFRREMKGFKITLESGEKLILAENTVLCGQFGGNLVSEMENEVLCFANMGRFYDGEDSRRTFKIEFQAPEKYSRQLKTICRHSASRLSNSDYEKKFYGYSDVMRFLRTLHQKIPNARIIPGLGIDRHYDDKLYDICKAKGRREIFLPLVRFTNLYGDSKNGRAQYFPALTAFCSKASGAECRKIISCEEFTSDGPWAFPIFDDHDDFSTPSHHRFSFTANGIPVFYPNEFIDEQIASFTIPEKGTPQLPPLPVEDENKKRDPVCYDLDSVYDCLLELGIERPDSGENVERLFCILFETLSSLAATKAEKRNLVNALEKKVIDLHRAKVGNI